MKSSLPRIFRLLRAWLALASMTLALPAGVRADGLPREKGAIYLDDIVGRPYRLQVLTDAPIYFNSDQARFLGTLRRGQMVELQAISDHLGVLRVRGQASQGQVVGWVPARYLSPMEQGFVDGLRRSIERQRQVGTLTASGEVALGMTPPEVAASLGPPSKKSSHMDVQGVSEAWDYIRYEQVPRQVAGVDTFGRPVINIVYERVPVGHFSVVFTGGLVTAIDQSDRVTNGSAPALKVVPPPVVFGEG